MLEQTQAPRCSYLFLIVMVTALLLCGDVGQCQQSFSYKPPRFTDSNRLAKMRAALPVLDSLVKAHAMANHYPGFAYALVAGDQVLHTGVYGFTDVENKTAVSPKSMFRIASMTKSFTAMAVIKLRDEGKLQLDDAAELYIPELKQLSYLTSDAPRVTVRHLLTHAAGFPEDNPWGDRRLADTDTELMALIAKGIHFSNVPGVAYEYSNLAFALLGHLITQVSGMPYEQYINQNILQPLGMNHTQWEYAEVPASLLAHGYRWQNNSWVEQPLLHAGAFGAMGGLITSVEDFARYIALHLSATPPSNNKDAAPVKRSSLREMQQPWNINTFSPHYRFPGGSECATISAYGYGLRWMKDCNNKVYVGHSGGLPGFGSEWKMMPDYGIGIVSVANLTYAGISTLNLRLLDTLIAIAGLQPAQLPPSAILQQGRDALVQLLPDWKGAENSGVFADNFFSDYPIDSLRKEARQLFEKAGPVKKITDVTAQNQLRGSFEIEMEKRTLEIWFTLTPENPPRIQEYHIRALPR